ncbi:MAG TPA: hypothetical protein VFL51_18120 [Pseudolabrys sp.]|nr:hypothetical protein [Pseudolabrys sp.]
MSSRSWKIAAAGILIAASAGLAAAHVESNPMEHRGPGMMREMGPGMMGTHGMSMAHDDATNAQLAHIHELFINHDKIKRTVENLPDGIRTMTESDDPHIAQLIKDHVASMGKRVETGNDPGLPIESDALHSIFKDCGKIATKVETADKGVIVVQTSADKDTVASLQQHASEVSDFVTQGMQAMRNAMMKKMGGMMPAAMHVMPGHRGSMPPAREPEKK